MNNDKMFDAMETIFDSKRSDGDPLSEAVGVCAQALFDIFRTRDDSIVIYWQANMADAISQTLDFGMAYKVVDAETLLRLVDFESGPRNLEEAYIQLADQLIYEELEVLMTAIVAEARRELA